jgi:glutathione S-transferase
MAMGSTRARPEAKLYVLPGSTSSMTGRLLLEHKEVDYERVDLPPAVHRALLRARMYRAGTVPALRLGGQRVQGTLSIARELERTRPDPPLFPADVEERNAVEAAERWAEANLQRVPRRLVSWALRRNRAPLRGMMDGAKLAVPTGLAVATAGPLIWLSTRIYGSDDDDAVRQDLAELPALLDRVDACIAEGILDGREPNAADFQIAPNVRALLLFDDLAPLIADRPAAELARRVVPVYPGRIPPVFPGEWLEPLARASTSATNESLDSV